MAAWLLNRSHIAMCMNATVSDPPQTDLETFFFCSAGSISATIYEFEYWQRSAYAGFLIRRRSANGNEKSLADRDPPAKLSENANEVNELRQM